jgi:glycosyltransferase involved in cell wall biosynthesis
LDPIIHAVGGLFATLVCKLMQNPQSEGTLRSPIKFGAVAIGRNEGERLTLCLQSLSDAAAIVYVDSGSTDDSPSWARQHGIEVVELDQSLPFTAARARNAGFRRLMDVVGNTVDYVQFIDGDCELNRRWPSLALDYLADHPDIVAVYGRRRERFPTRSVYNWLCDLEWDGPAGEARSFFGDVMIRAGALVSIGGYRDDLIAGEEPELSVRLRAGGWRIWRLPSEMTLHDAAITRFGQWWRRAVRAGYAFAQGAHIHGARPERHWVWESRRAWLWGVLLPLACLMCTAVIWPWGAVAWLIYPLQVLRQTIRNCGSLSIRLKLALFQVLSRFPEGAGQLKFLRDRLLGGKSELVEYK